MHNGGSLPHGAVHQRQVGQMRMRRHDNGGGEGLKRARGHGILLLGLVVGIPLRLHLLHVLGVGVGMAIVLGMVVLRIRVVVYGRVRLRRDVVLILVLLPPSLIRPGRRHIRAWHHGLRLQCVLPRPSVAGQRDQAANARGDGGDGVTGLFGVLVPARTQEGLGRRGARFIAETRARRVARRPAEGREQRGSWQGAGGSFHQHDMRAARLPAGEEGARRAGGSSRGAGVNKPQ